MHNSSAESPQAVPLLHLKLQATWLKLAQTEHQRDVGWPGRVCLVSRPEHAMQHLAPGKNCTVLFICKERITVQANEDHSLAHCSSSQQCQQVGAGWLAQLRSPDREPLPCDNSRNTAWCWQDRSRMALRLPSHTALRTLPRHSHSSTEALDGLFLSPLFDPLQLEKSPLLTPHSCILVLHSMPLF